MKTLKELFDTNLDIEIKNIKTFTKDVEKGDLFVCIKGLHIDRHTLAQEAKENGAVALVVDHDIPCDLPKIYVDDTNKALLPILKKFYGEKNKQMKMIGVTGTDGKTSTSTIIYNFLNQISKCGYIGTNGIMCPDYEGNTNNTTPAIEHLHHHFYEFYNKGCKYVSMEASSEAMAQGRIEDILYDYSIFTNLTHEHLNFHKTMDNYLLAKSTLFKQTKKDGCAIINIDDPYGEKISKYAKCNVIYYGSSKKANVRFYNEKITCNHTEFDIDYNNKTYHITSPLLGRFNIYNLTAALSVMLLLGVDIEKLDYSSLYVDGRVEKIDLGQDFKVIVDYAHTPNGYLNLFELIKELKHNRIITVAGSAGERDHEKRPEMGKILAENSDLVVFTYEDPRSEDPNDIINDLVKDIKTDNYIKIVDRHEAINYAINNAKKDDIVLILGKGNETYEILKNGKIYFNDVNEAKNALKKRIEG